MGGLRRLLLVSVLTLVACGPGGEPPPVLVPIGEFTLTDQTGAPFGSADLAGRPYVADFIFTSCPDVCPVLSVQMANLARRLEGTSVGFVSISVDPETDTPEVLAAYAARYDADPDRWRFLTGPPDRVRAVIQERFRLPAGPQEPRPDGRYDILHGQRFVLVDGEGRLRGLYERDAAGLERLEADARRLAAE